MNTPKIRRANKVKPPYPLGEFSSGMVVKIGREIVYHLATNPQPSIEGPEWERIFAEAIGAEWKPSNIGLDDVVLGVCAWGAKTVKATNPHKTETVRLISGRNSPAYSFDKTNLDANANDLGRDVLRIWNARVEEIRSRFSHTRTVVLIKSNNLADFALFELDTTLFIADQYNWTRNNRGNLEGREIDTGKHRFTWQPHGSQFTIIEQVPQNRVRFRVRAPTAVSRDEILAAVGFESSWVEIVD